MHKKNEKVLVVLYTINSLYAVIIIFIIFVYIDILGVNGKASFMSINSQMSSTFVTRQNYDFFL